MDWDWLDWRAVSEKLIQQRHNTVLVKIHSRREIRSCLPPARSDQESPNAGAKFRKRWPKAGYLGSANLRRSIEIASEPGMFPAETRLKVVPETKNTLHPPTRPTILPGSPAAHHNIPIGPGSASVRTLNRP